jgi:sialate O-acetylesterase
MVALACGVIAAPAHAGLLADVFQDHAVVQRDRPIAVWGEAEPGQSVVVQFDGVEVPAQAGEDGRWRIDLPAHAAGGPFTLVATAGALSESRSDILVGDVWLCSGQSNMEFQLRYATNAWTELRSIDDPDIRILKVPRRSSTTPRTDLPEGSVWAVNSADATANFSAVCYFMARELRQHEDVPLGLIDASWGGSIIQDWISPQALQGAGGYEEEFAILEAHARSPAEGRARLSEVMRRWSAERDPGDAAGWSAADFDDGDWLQMPLDGFWEDSDDASLAHFDGTLWYRKHFSVNKAQAEAPGKLSLGPADDLDTTFINGVEIGMLSGWNTPREYDLPAGVLREGENVIAVRVIDTGGGGGLWGPAEERRIAFAGAASISLDGEWRYRVSAPLAEAGAPPRVPWIGGSGISTIANGMLEPLVPYGLAGIAWYQGESNVAEATEYVRLQALLADDLRTRFASLDAPFVLAQLTAYGAYTVAPGRSSWAELREAQRQAAAADRRMAMAVIADVGDVHDIHPTQKRLVGERLAREVLYMRKAGSSPPGGTTSPSPVKASRIGPRIIVSIATTMPPLHTVGSDHAIGFELCDQADSCRYADARIVQGDIVVDVPAGVKPTLVRYGWSDAPLINVFDDTKVPMTPFEIELSE